MPFLLPTTTPVPDELFDVWLKHLSESELKVLLYIVRRTLGFRKDADSISYDQFLHGITTKEGRVLDEGCLTHRTTLKRALDGLEEKGLIRAHKSKTDKGDSDVTLYSLCFVGDTTTPTGEDSRAQSASPRGSTQMAPPWCAKGTTPGTQMAPGVVRKRHPQQTEKQQTEKQEKTPLPPQGGATGAGPVRTRRRRVAEEANPDKYTGGRYGVCAVCLCSPCDPACPTTRQERA